MDYNPKTYIQALHEACLYAPDTPSIHGAVLWAMLEEAVRLAGFDFEHFVATGNLEKTNATAMH